MTCQNCLLLLFPPRHKKSYQSDMTAVNGFMVKVIIHSAGGGGGSPSQLKRSHQGGTNLCQERKGPTVLHVSLFGILL